MFKVFLCSYAISCVNPFKICTFAAVKKYQKYIKVDNF